MYNMKTLNKISKIGLAQLDDGFEIGAEGGAPGRAPRPLGQAA